MKALVFGAALAVAMAAANPADAQKPIRLYAAGSLRSALTDVGQAFTREHGAQVAAIFGASGLLRERIERGEPAEVFASADTGHPTTLMKAGRAGPVTVFARNRLCALTSDKVAVAPDTLLDRLLDPAIRVGTSTPKADPSGDYAWALFEKAEKQRPGSYATLDAKALKLTGGLDSPTPPQGLSLYGFLMREGRADVFLTYCTNAMEAVKQVPSLRIVAIPEPLSVGADYGLVVMTGARPDAQRLAEYILSPAGQRTLTSYGFAPGG